MQVYVVLYKWHNDCTSTEIVGVYETHIDARRAKQRTESKRGALGYGEIVKRTIIRSSSDTHP